MENEHPKRRRHGSREKTKSDVVAATGKDQADAGWAQVQATEQVVAVLVEILAELQKPPGGGP